MGLAGLGWAAWGRGEEPAGSRRRVLDVDPRELLGRGLRRLAEGEEVEELLAEFPSESLEADALEGARAVLGPEPRQAGRRLRRVRIKGLKHPALLGLEAVGRARSGGQPDAAGDLALLDALGAAWAARPAVREARARTLRELGRLSEAVEALGANAPALAAALLTELADRALTQGELEAAATWVEDARFDPAAAPERVATLGGLTEQRFEAALVTGERAQTSSDPSWLLAAAACLRIQRALRPDFALPPEQVRRFCDLAPRWVSGNTTEAFRTLHAQVLACVADEPAELLAEVVVQDAPYRPDQAAVVLAHLRRALAGLQGGLADLLRTREVELLATVDPGQARAAASVALERIEDPSLREVLRVQRARAANRLGLHQEALGDVEGSTSAQARIQQAYACLGLGRGDDAARAAGALLETGLVANTFAHNAAKHAWQAFGLGSREPARAALARYAELSGARPEGLVHAAAAHWACDQREAARELLARSDRHQPGLVPAGLLEALEQDPDPAGAWLLRWAKSVGEP